MKKNTAARLQRKDEKEFRMTANEYAKGSDICSRLSTAAGQLIEAVERLLALKALKDGTGYDFTNNGFEAHMATGSLKFIADGTDWHNVMGSAETLKTWLVDNGHWGVFQKVRP
jgi:hypothetical protein